MKKIIFTGGGTAGHIYPIVAIIDALKSNARVDMLYVGCRSGLEREIVADKEIKFKGIFVGKRRNYFSFNNFTDFFKILIGLIQSYFIVIAFKPDLIFSKGGYVAFPMVYWAKRFHIPLVVHESDSVMGSLNLYASKFAKKILVGFPVEYYKDQGVPFEKIIYTGTPIRSEFKDVTSEKSDKLNILVTGGSQGASKINSLILEIVPELTKKYNVYHLVGKGEFEKIKNQFQNENYHCLDFAPNMAELMSKADLIISRAGSTIAEIALLGRASILIPLPFSHMDHQTKNAQIFAEKSAAVMLSEKGLTSTSLLSIINHLMEDDHFRGLIGHHAREFSSPNAAKEIVDILFELPKV